jgi:hypothetical protein
VKEVPIGDMDAKSADELRSIVRGVEDPFAKSEADKFKKATRFRTIERLIGISAVICFILGYLPALGFVIYIALD